MAAQLFLYVWTNRVESPTTPGKWVGGFWTKYCAGVHGDEPLYLNWIADAVVRSGWAKHPDHVHIGTTVPTEQPASANVSRVYDWFDNETPPDKPHPLP